MMPGFIDDPAIARADNYRRGRMLTLIVVLGTACLFLWSSVKHMMFDHPTEASLHVEISNYHLSPMAAHAVELTFEGLLVFLFCRCAFRAGSTSTGCLTIFYSMVFVMFTLAALINLLVLPWQAKEGSSLELPMKSAVVFGQTFEGPLSIALLGLWIVFAFWVLTVSRDARFYRHARQRGLWLAASPELRLPPKL